MTKPKRREIMTARTAFLSRLIGIFCIIESASMAINKQASVQTVTALVHDLPLMFVFGLILLAVGLALVLIHNLWTGGALTIVVTLVGWLTLAKGLLLLLLPPQEAVGIFIWGNIYDQFFYADVAFAFVLGVYLTYGGFKLK
jgi:hypothetical protein